ncbi:MAG: hypothetical protein JXB32_06215 [Deltaproteobacteria bacterium]|nr:hypothetical protein [Deltaproteobacteria bacterium]
MNEIGAGLWPAAVDQISQHSRRGHRGEPRLDGRRSIVPNDLGVRIPPATRALLDRLRDRHGLDDAEVARTLLAAGMYAGLSLRDRVAIALFASGTMRMHGEFARVAAGMRTALAASCAAIARTEPPTPARAPRIDRGPRDETLLRVKLGDLLHRRVRELVGVYLAVRRDGEVPDTHDETQRRLVDHLLQRSAADVRRERSPVAETLRWALTAAGAEAEADGDRLIRYYVACRTAVWRRIDRAVAAMRSTIEKEIGSALDAIG